MVTPRNGFDTLYSRQILVLVLIDDDQYFDKGNITDKLMG